LTDSESRRVDRLARLAKLSISEIEAEGLESQINRLIQFVDQIQSYDLKDAIVSEENLTNQLRSDDDSSIETKNLDVQSWQSMPKIFRVKRILD
jgi:aspartyl/glutamyl-tRNA(Asn/Gln) amidotransferase C subunit